MVAAYRAASLDATDYWAQSPRTPAHAAVAYAQGKRRATLPPLRFVLLTLLALLLLLGAAAAFAAALSRRNGGAYGRARTVLVIDCGSSGSRM
jgi:hypothetical protein